MWWFMAATETLWILFLAMEVMGVSVDYIGCHISYYEWAAGISEKRANWIVERIDRAETANWVITGRGLSELVGRLNFVTRLLTWLKPFLAPLFAWSNALSRSTAAQAPEMVITGGKFQMVLDWMPNAKSDGLCWEDGHLTTAWIHTGPLVRAGSLSL